MQGCLLFTLSSLLPFLRALSDGFPWRWSRWTHGPIALVVEVMIWASLRLAIADHLWVVGPHFDTLPKAHIWLLGPHVSTVYIEVIQGILS